MILQPFALFLLPFAFRLAAYPLPFLASKPGEPEGLGRGLGLVDLKVC